MRTPSTTAAANAREAGYGLTILFRVVLLTAVLAEVVFLGTRFRVRTDLTGDRIYSLTPSTQAVLDSLDDRLLIECYFTHDDKLPKVLQAQRREMKSVLDEYVRRSKGKVDVQYFDPQSDLLLRQKAERLQMRPEVREDLEIGELRQQQIWQGMRLRYAGDRQEVIPFLQFHGSTFQYEWVLTPRIKNLATKDKPKVKILAGMSPSASRNNQKGYQQIRAIERFDFSDLDLSEGKLVPDDTAIVLLFRPRDLNDRAKYALDQYLMRGGKLVVFADTDDVDIGSQDYRSFHVTKVEYDTTDSKVRFLDQLAGYGAKVGREMVADAFMSNTGLAAQEPMLRVKQTNLGPQGEQVFYPYLLHALAVDWGSDDVVAQLARNPRTGELDSERARQYRAAFEVGLLHTHALSVHPQYGPGMFWPCPVDIVDDLPEGVTGETIARTSPLTVVQEPPREVNPFGTQSGPVPDPAQTLVALQKFQEAMSARILLEPRRQVGLIVALRGTFPSAFAGKDLPPRKKPVKKEVDPLTQKVGKEGEEPPQETTPPEAAEQSGQEPEPIGPPIPGEGGSEQAADKDEDPPFLAKAAPEAQLVVVGDSDFLRDDFVTGVYGQVGKAMVIGPVSDQRAAAFLNNVLDWLIQDSDLVALRTKTGTDRTIRLGQQDVLRGESLEAFNQRIAQKAAVLQWANVGGPAALLLVAWLVVSVRRGQRKAAFLRRVGT